MPLGFKRKIKSEESIRYQNMTFVTVKDLVFGKKGGVVSGENVIFQQVYGELH